MAVVLTSPSGGASSTSFGPVSSFPSRHRMKVDPAGMSTFPSTVHLSLIFPSNAPRGPGFR